MSLRMAAPTPHPKSGTYRLRLAIPKHLRATAKALYGQSAELIANLGTKDPKAAKRLAPARLGELQAKLDAAQATLDRKTADITDRDMRALAGEFYRAKVREAGDHAGDRAYWVALLDGLSECVSPVGAEEHHITPTEDDLADATALLTGHGFPADPVAVQELGKAVFQARWDFYGLMQRRAAGDWSPDPTPAKLPAPSPALRRRKAGLGPGVTFDTILAGFALDRGWGGLDAKPIHRALYDRKRTLARLEDFLGHGDPERVTKAAAVSWKEDMQARGLHASTIRNDLSECSAVWRWSARNGKLSEGCGNPFEGISPPKAKKKAQSRRPFTEAEARKVLTMARQETGVLRWVPWVCCLSGARLNEIVQSVKEDVATIDGVPVLRIHDEGEGRSIKNADSLRTVPIHPALAAEGFLEYVAALPTGSALFPDVRPDKVFGQRAPEAGRKVSRWLKATVGITDPAISPVHSWRHYMIDACRRVSMPTEVRSALTGHSGRMDESAGYGDGVKSMVALMAEALAKVPVPVGPPMPGV